MVIVAGHITVDPEQRESYLAGCMSVVEKARRRSALVQKRQSVNLQQGPCHD
jgi:hypothetical protein